MTKKNRLIAVILAVMVVFVMLFSVFFIASNADHDCIGEDCPICYEISVCNNALKVISYAFISVAVAALIASITYVLPALVENRAGSSSLVSLKVKLSD